MEPQPQQLNEIMKKIEEDGMQKVKDSKVIQIPPDQAISSLKTIIADGGKEFEQKAGRPMTYAEMRMMFG